MALPATSVFEVRTTGSDLNGGGFNPSRGGGGVDRSQQDSPYVDIDNGELVVTVHTTTTQVSGTFLTVSTADLGNFFQITGGTATPGTYEITAVDTINRRWTLDRSAGTAGQTIVGRMGGAFATPGKASSVAIDGNVIWQAAGTYLITSTSANVASGRIALATGVKLRGYGSTRGDRATRPVNKASGIASVTLLGFANATERSMIDFVEADGDLLTSIRGFGGAGGSITNSVIHDCVGRNCTNSAFASVANNCPIVRCYATGCTTVAAFISNTNIPFFYCVAVANSVTGFGVSSSATNCVGCISAQNTGASSHGFFHNNTSGIFVGCTAQGNGGDGFRSTGGLSKGFTAQNCLAYGNAGYGFNHQSTDQGVMIGCAAGSNTSGNINNSSAVFQFTTLVSVTADPFTNAAGANFALNSTAGGGAACKAAGIPGTFPGGLTTGYLDIGAVQSQASTAGYPRGVNV